MAMKKSTFCRKTLGATLIFFLFYVILFTQVTNNRNLLLFIASVFLYFYAAQTYIRNMSNTVWVYIGKTESCHRLTAFLGNLEEMIYMLAFVLGQFSFIGVLFGIKIASRLIGFTKIEKTDDYIEEGERRNAYLIGNIISLGLGILGGIFLKTWLNINHPGILGTFKEFLFNVERFKVGS